MVLDKKELLWNLTHPKKSRRDPTTAEDGQNEIQLEPQLGDSRTNERRVRTDQDRNRGNQERSKSTPGRSRPKSNDDKRRTVRDNSSLKKKKALGKDTFDDSDRDRVRANLPISNAGKLDAILHFFPTLRSCCCCWRLRTGCLIIGWTQVIGCVMIGGVQGLIALICMEIVDIDHIFNNFPPEYNPAKTVSEFADDFCAGLSIGYASGEAVGFFTGIMLLVGVSKDMLYLLRLWVYVVLLMILPTITFYGIAIYAVVEYKNDIPVIAVPSAIELATFAVLCYCTSIVKSYYYQRIDQLLGIVYREPLYTQETQV